VSELYRIRSATDRDTGFVLKTWKLLAVETPPLNLFFNKTLLLAVFNAAVERLFDGSTCRIACSPDDESTILGFAVANPHEHLLHFIYTKSVYRRFGIANALLKQFPGCTVATMWSRMAEDLGPERGFTYKPSRAWPTATADTNGDSSDSKAEAHRLRGPGTRNQHEDRRGR
jgi:GNAT superfamily N-acetyltransferase